MAAATFMRALAAAISTARTFASCNAVGRAIGSGRLSGWGAGRVGTSGLTAEAGAMERGAADAGGSGGVSCGPTVGGAQHPATAHAAASITPNALGTRCIVASL